jgi:hypothetical protein
VWKNSAVSKQKPKSSIAAARFQADEHEQAAAEFSQNDQRQQPTVNPMGLRIVGDAGITRDLPGALDDKM